MIENSLNLELMQDPLLLIILLKVIRNTYTTFEMIGYFMNFKYQIYSFISSHM